MTDDDSNNDGLSLPDSFPHPRYEDADDAYYESQMRKADVYP